MCINIVVLQGIRISFIHVRIDIFKNVLLILICIAMPTTRYNPHKHCRERIQNSGRLTQQFLRISTVTLSRMVYYFKRPTIIILILILAERILVHNYPIVLKRTNSFVNK